MVFRLNAAVSKLVRRISILLSSSSFLSLFIPRVSSRFSSSLLRKARVCSFQTGGFSRDRNGCQLGSHCPATNSLESART